jgi:hypothetical protein
VVGSRREPVFQFPHYTFRFRFKNEFSGVFLVVQGPCQKPSKQGNTPLKFPGTLHRVEYMGTSEDPADFT